MIARIFPSTLKPLNLLERGDLLSCRGEAFVASLPFEIARRELSTLKERLGWPVESFRPRQSNDSLSPGNVVSVEIERGQITEFFSVIGERGISAELVAERAAAEAQENLDSNVPVGRHLADQLLLPLAFNEGGAFWTLLPAEHTLSQINLLRQILARKIVVAADSARARIDIGTGPREQG